jgi:hypothetical protein
MHNPAPRPQPFTARGAIQVTSGFAIYEVLLVFLILMLGVTLLLTLLSRARQQQNCEAFIEDLGRFSTVFSEYEQTNHRWPASSHPGTNLPPEIVAKLEGSNWTKGSPFGGSYTWVAHELTNASDGLKPKWDRMGAVTLTAFSPSFPLTMDQSDLINIDRKIDDGNLATGRFRTGFNGWPVYLVKALKP